MEELTKSGKLQLLNSNVTFCGLSQVLKATWI